MSVKPIRTLLCILVFNRFIATLRLQNVRYKDVFLKLIQSPIVSQNVRVTFIKPCVCSQNTTLMYFVFSLTDLVENFDEASKNEANWRSLFFSSVNRFKFFVTSLLDSQRAFPLVGKRLLKVRCIISEDVNHFGYSLPQQLNNSKQTQKVLISVGCGHAEKRGLN